MKELLILRHAKSSWADERLADHDRPLNARGERDAPRMGAFLRAEDLVPDLIVSSSAKRARKTAEAVADACGYEGDVRLSRHLYGAGPSVYLAVARACDDDVQRLMLVGHNPGIEELVELLSASYERMPTAALAHFELAVATWSAFTSIRTARLVNLWLPRELPG